MKNNDIPNFNLLAVFATVIEHGSLSRAADHLSTNQSTISTAIARLKQELGQELFIRQGRGVVPTTYALSLYEQVRDPIQQLGGVFNALEQFNPRTSQRKFVLAAPEHLQWVLLDGFSKLSDTQVTLEIYDQPDNDDKSYEGLVTQKFDAMIDILVSESPSIESAHLFDGRFVIVCREQHPRIQGSMTQEQYFGESHAVLERTRNQTYSLGHYTNIDISRRKVVYHGRSLFNNMMLCSQSDIITIVPLSVALQFKARLQLQVINPPFSHTQMSNYLIWNKKHSKDPAHQWFRQQVMQSLDNTKQLINPNMGSGVI